MERSDIGRVNAVSEVGSYSTYNLSYSQVDTQAALSQDLWMSERRVVEPTRKRGDCE